jgi:homoserine dehydrogenase
MQKKMKAGIALLGCGTVGGSVARILTKEKEMLGLKNNIGLDLKYIVDVKFDYAKKIGLDPALFTSDLDKALNDPDVSIVIELIGGTKIAKDYMERAIRAGKRIVTANKALLAHHGKELLALARKHGVSIAFEASCAGGVPIIRALTDGLVANRIDAIYGIVNGTSNFILTEMIECEMAYADALADAQSIGLAEADPTLDVAGIDSAHKLSILASLAFGESVDFASIPVEGIDKLDLQDIMYGSELGYVIKLLAVAQRQEKGLCLYVRPAFISIKHPLAWVAEAFNAVSVYGHATGHTMYYGRGAGGDPTASAIIADLYQTASGVTEILFSSLNLWPDESRPAVQLPRADIFSRYYIRITADDKPGVLSKIAEKFGKYGISLSSVLQKEPGDEESGSPGVPVIITTYPSLEGNVISALTEIDNLDVIKTKSVCIVIVDEHPEKR